MTEFGTWRARLRHQCWIQPGATAGLIMIAVMVSGNARLLLVAEARHVDK